MEETDRNAYLHLLYRCLVEIRSLSVHPRTWWNPATWGQQNDTLRQINRISNVFHNLPFELRTDTEPEVDEVFFWKSIAQYEQEKGSSIYRSLFEKIQNGEKRKVLD